LRLQQRQIEMGIRNLKSLGERAHRFAALGDATRLSIVEELSRNKRQNITELTKLMLLTRQATTKHLRVLEKAKIVRSVRSVRDGRENLFELEVKTCNDLQDYLKTINKQWEDALARLKDFVE
jgi:DNA-binding transcriptional ArsR family regulator